MGVAGEKFYVRHDASRDIGQDREVAVPDAVTETCERAGNRPGFRI
jgi:hypothetical protein